ncbi:type IV pilus assembly protein PilM [Eikenella halliae]|uniref:type IV pilus assembly protein PilM n=1 Tax=Eikenella halliae TaxID=1795832 RepID=UPI0036141171
MRISKKPRKSKQKAKMSFGSKGCLGVDITPTAINMVHLAGSVPGNLRLENYTIQPLPKGVIINGNIEDHDQLVSYLQQAYQRLGSSCKNVTAALPQALTNIQTITYDARSADLPVDEFVELEASQTIGSDNLSYDFQVTAELQNGNVQEIVMAAAKRDDVDLRRDLFADADIPLSQMDVDTFAVVNAFSVWIDQFAPDLEHQKLAIFHVDEEQTKALILQNGSIVYKQETNFGNKQLTHNIQRQYKLSEDDAWSMRFKSNKPADFQGAVADHFNSQLTQEIQRVLQFYYTTVSSDYQDSVKHILISGCPFMQPFGLAKSVYAQTNISTQQVEPIVSTQGGKQTETSKFNLESGQLTVAFGLAVRGL